MVAEIVRNSQDEIRSPKYANEIEIQTWIRVDFVVELIFAQFYFSPSLMNNVILL